MRVNLNIPDELLKQVDVKANELFINRTAWIVTAISQKLQQDDLINQMPSMINVMKEAILLKKLDISKGNDEN